MTKVCLVSDLHSEFHDHQKLYDCIPEDGYDILLLLGDLSESPSFVAGICDKIKDKPIIYVLGNHECYSKFGGTFKDHENLYIDYERTYKNLKVIGSKSDFIDIGNYRFFGSTGWPEIPPMEAYSIQRSISDYYYKKLTISMSNDFKWSQTNDFKVLVDTDKTLIGLTHFIPHIDLVNEKFINSPLNVYFVSPIDYNIYSKCKWWFFGHAHDPTDNVNIDGCTFVSNPYGYPHETSSNYKARIIEL